MRKINQPGTFPAIPPNQLAALFVFVILLFTATAAYQYHARTAELEHLMHEESAILVKALTNSAETALLGYQELNALSVESIDTSKLLQLKCEVGPGRLIQRIGTDEAGIAYIIWQDNSAIISATPNITETVSIQSDAALSAAFHKNGPSSRLTTFEGQQVFEVINPFLFKGEKIGILRIGLRADHLEIASKRLLTQLLMLLGLATAGALAVFSLMNSRHNEQKMSAAYRREQLFSSTILSNMADAVIAIDSKKKITLINTRAEQLLQVTSQEVTGQTISSILPETSEAITRLLNAGEASQVEEEFSCMIHRQKKILSGRYNHFTAHPETPKGIVIVLQDITLQRAMQMMIERREKLTAMGELASGVAHEIRNPLNAIGIIAQRLDMEFTPTEVPAEEYHHLTGSIVAEVNRVNTIIQRFLKFARPPKLVQVPTNIDEWLKSCQHILEGEASAQGIEIRIHAASGCSSSIDRDQMLQALLNLVRNAAEASPPHARITIHARKDKGMVAIEVRDTGSGIPEALQKQVFNLYFTTKNDGTGMGLSITNQIVQAHGGLINVHSKPGQGSTFCIVLPAIV